MHLRTKNNNPPVVSVIMLTYNHERFIASAVRSVLSQTYKNIDFSIIDDCSKDRTKQILEQIYQDNPELNLILNDKNFGIGSSVNSALKMAKGKYVKIVAGDDFIFPDAIQQQVDILEKTPHASFCYTNMYWTWRLNTFLRVRVKHYGFFQKRADSVQSIINDCTITIPTLMFRNLTLKNSLFKNHYDRLADLALLLKLLELGPGVYLNKITVQYNRHDQNQSKLNSLYEERINLKKEMTREGSIYQDLSFKEFDKLILYSLQHELIKIDETKKCLDVTVNLTKNSFKSVKWFIRVTSAWFVFFRHIFKLNFINFNRDH